MDGEGLPTWNQTFSQAMSLDLGSSFRGFSSRASGG